MTVIKADSACALPLAITPGEPAGVGPDCILSLAARDPELTAVVFADHNLLSLRAQQLQLEISLQVYQPAQAWPPAKPGLYVHHVPLLTDVKCGQLNTANVPYVLECIRLAALGCQAGSFHAMVTGPVHKGIINDAGIAFSGHTEWLAQLLDAPHPVMVLASPSLRVALATTHVPLNKVSATLTRAHLTDCIKILAQGLSTQFAISQPKILVCGLNPHAGEAGHLGDEELKVIIPVLQALRQQQFQLIGPCPADTAFVPENLAGIDAVLAMYHDQGLPVIKTIAFHSAVNVTLGLPIIRTSVDHGTALELAGTGQAHSDSLLAAIQLARQLHQSTG